MSQLGVTIKTTCPIRLQGSLIMNFLGKESIDILTFLHEVSHQEKVAPETTGFSK